MRFQVIGANAESGDDVDVMVDAPTQMDVEKIAHERGIMVSVIKPIAGAAGPGGTHAPAHAAPAVGHATAHGAAAVAHATAHGAAAVGHATAHGAPAVAHAPAHAPKEDPGSIALVDDEPPSNGNGNGEHHERAHGIITVNANTPSDTAHSAEGHIAAEKKEAAAEYHIIMNQSLYLLESAVNKHLRDGWDVAGGMSVATANNALNYFQSMIRRKKPTA